MHSNIFVLSADENCQMPQSIDLDIVQRMNPSADYVGTKLQKDQFHESMILFLSRVFPSEAFQVTKDAIDVKDCSNDEKKKIAIDYTQKLHEWQESEIERLSTVFAATILGKRNVVESSYGGLISCETLFAIISPNGCLYVYDYVSFMFEALSEPGKYYILGAFDYRF